MLSSSPLAEAPPRRRFEAGLVLAGGAVVLPPLAVYAPLGLALLLALVALAVLATDWRRVVAAIPGYAPLILLLAALSFWGAASAAWSILPGHSLAESLRFLAISAGGVVTLAAAGALRPGERDRFGHAAAVGVAAAVLLLLVERASNLALSRWLHGWPADLPLPLTRFDRGATTLVLALWPALCAPGRHRLRSLGLAIAAAAAVLLLASTTAKLALLLSFAVFAAAALAPRRIAAAVGLALLLVAAALPLATPGPQGVGAIARAAPWLKFTAIHRLMIWRFTADRIAERPLLGWGLDASRELPGGRLDLAKAFPGLPIASGSEALPLHPHDALLQWEVELGVPGTLLCLGIVGWGLWRAGWADGLTRADRAGALAWAAAALSIAMLSYGAWQEWWLACLWLTLALQCRGPPRAPVR